MRLISNVNVCFVCLASLQCLVAQATLRFEVATVKPSAPDSKGGMGTNGPNRLVLTNATPLGILSFAYAQEIGVGSRIVGAPNWAEHDRFDIEGVASGRPTQEQFRMMVRELLTERFGLRLHQEEREANVYALTLARDDGRLGPKLVPWNGKCSNREPAPANPSSKTPRCAASFRTPGLTIEGGSMSVLADMLSGPIVNLDRAVVDHTGLAGEFNITLVYDFFAPNSKGPSPNAQENDQPSIFTAIREQLGLTLVPRKGRVKVLTIDSISHPSEN